MLALSFVFANTAIANTYPVLWDLSVAGLSGGTPFTADALKATEVSHIQFTDSFGSFTEHGYAPITGVLNNGVFSVPAGLNSSYTLYMDFSGKGNAALGQLFTATETLYGVNGVSTFGIDPITNDAFVDNGSNTPVKLAVSSLITGTVGSVGADQYDCRERLFIARLEPAYPGLQANNTLSSSSGSFTRRRF